MVSYYLQSDPVLNQQFRRRWTDPPPKKRERRSGQGAALTSILGNTNCDEHNLDTTAEQAPGGAP
jgi:hypothetical protein